MSKLLTFKKEYYPFIVYNTDNSELANGFMNQKAWEKTIENSKIWEYMPENQRVLEKDLKAVSIDFDQIKLEDDTILFFIKENSLTNDQSQPDSIKEILFSLEQIIKNRKEKMPPNSYTTHLFEKGSEKILKKLGEETIEVVLAKNEEEIIYESADLIYHLMVYLREKEIPLNKVLEELGKRMWK
ncbi:MAG: phosphoribosyl-ATP diphosphatase [Spirochaetes bacterium]|nr:phosphoribosyl-ATP diphosphatase [Spirochaetota bacterium]